MAGQGPFSGHRVLAVYVVEGAGGLPGASFIRH